MNWKLAALSVTLALFSLSTGCATNDGNRRKVSDIVGVWNGDAQYCIGMEKDGVQPVRSAVTATFHADSTVSFSFSGVFQALPGQEEGAMGSDSHGIWRHLGCNEYEILHTDMIYKKDLKVVGFPASPASRDRNTAIFTIHPNGTATWSGESAFHDPFDLDFTGPSEGTCRYNGSFKRLGWPVSETKNK
jgi:hypothetical protein